MRTLLIIMLCVMGAFSISVHAQEGDGYLQRAKELFKNGDYGEAIKNFNLYKAYVPDSERQNADKQIKDAKDCQTAIQAADLLFDKGNYKDAMPEYYKVIQLNPENSYARERYNYCKATTQVTPITSPPTSHNDSWIIGGRNVSFGITAGLVSANFNTSASGNYIGSAIDYGYGNDSEKPSYSSEIGFSAGIMLDIRLDKNLYLQMGLNYVNAKVKNSFKNSFTDQFDQTNTTYVKGIANDEFYEHYELNYIEMPLLLSYRFKLSEKSNFQINAGPYIGYGITGKCKITGTTDWPRLDEYYKSNDVATGQWYLMNCTYDGNLDLFGKTGKSTTSYTTGDQHVNEYEYNFTGSPFININAGISAGVAFEFSGFNIGVSYDLGLINIANNDYWSSNRMNITQYKGGKAMEDYQQKLSKLQVKIGYIFRW